MVFLGPVWFCVRIRRDRIFLSCRPKNTRASSLMPLSISDTAKISLFFDLNERNMHDTRRCDPLSSSSFFLFSMLNQHSLFILSLISSFFPKRVGYGAAHGIIEKHLATRSINKTRQNKTRKTKQGKTRQGKARQGTTRQEKTRRAKARQGKTRQDKTMLDKTKQDCTVLGSFLCLFLSVIFGVLISFSSFFLSFFIFFDSKCLMYN
jgi:hypothetical protein